MGACTCGYSSDPEKNCNGTHNVVKAVKADLIAKLEAEGFAEAADHLKNNK
jgi:CDGSH-type Zn-finger protein